MKGEGMGGVAWLVFMQSWSVRNELECAQWQGDHWWTVHTPIQL